MPTVKEEESEEDVNHHVGPRVVSRVFVGLVKRYTGKGCARGWKRRSGEIASCIEENIMPSETFGQRYNIIVTMVTTVVMIVEVAVVVMVVIIIPRPDNLASNQYTASRDNLRPYSGHRHHP